MLSISSRKVEFLHQPPAGVMLEGLAGEDVAGAAAANTVQRHVHRCRRAAVSVTASVQCNPVFLQLMWVLPLVRLDLGGVLALSRSRIALGLLPFPLVRRRERRRRKLNVIMPRQLMLLLPQWRLQLVLPLHGGIRGQWPLGRLQWVESR